MTEIIKLSSLKNNLQTIFSSLLTRFNNKKNYDITLVIQENQNLPSIQYEEDRLVIENLKPLIEGQKENSQSQSEQPSLKEDFNFKNSKPGVVFNQNTMILNQDISDEISLSSASESVTRHKIKYNSQNKLADIQRGNPPMILMKKGQKSRSKEQRQKKPLRFKHYTINNYAQTEPLSDKRVIETELQIDNSIDIDKQYSVKINNLDLESANTSTQSSVEDNDSNAGFLIEKHLNQALLIIQEGCIDDLQDFLYNYKEKYSFINMRTQVKWSLLMAHCKESKLEFDRAAINYEQVITHLIQFPRMLTMDMGELYFKLGKCYYESQEWNKGVTSFTTALNLFKEGKKVNQYTNCMLSLGILYFQISMFYEAEKCFLTAYDIRRHEGDKSNPSNLLPVLFNLIDCNLNIKNYTQTQKLLNLTYQIISQSDQVDSCYIVGCHTKSAKLDFFLGDLEKSHKECQTAFSLLEEHRCQGKDYGQVLEIMGLLKQEKGEYQRSREYFEKALKVIQKHFSVQNIKLKVLKRRIESLSKFTNDSKDRIPTVPVRSPRNASDSQQFSSFNSDCLDLSFYDR